MYGRSPVLLYECRAINGVKDMVGFRETFNLCSDQGGNGSESTCDDDVGCSAILVREVPNQTQICLAIS